MSEIAKNTGINIIFRNPSGEINRVTVLSDREAQNVIRERAGLGDVPIASASGDEATDLTEKYRAQESSSIFSTKR
jgi:hypothetical protein